MSTKKWTEDSGQNDRQILSPVMADIIAFQKRLHKQNIVSAPQESAGAKDTIYFGCVDARLNPIIDLGLPESTMIVRTIASVIPPYGAKGGDLSEEIGKALEEGRTHFIVSAHTACGGLDACLNHPEIGKNLPSLGDHLSALHPAKAHVTSDDNAERMLQFEKASIHSNIDNLLTYPGIKEALDAGTITIDGWHINTHDRTFYKVVKSPETDVILTEDEKHVENNSLHKVANYRPPQFQQGEDPQIHNPQMLILTNTDGEIDMTKWGGQYGKMLVYRGKNPSDTSIDRVNAVIEFAVKAKEVKDVVLMLPFGHEEEMRQGIQNLRKNETIRDAIDKHLIKLHGWTVNPTTSRISSIDLDTGIFMDLGKEKISLC